MSSIHVTVQPSDDDLELLVDDIEKIVGKAIDKKRKDVLKLRLRELTFIVGEPEGNWKDNEWYKELKKI